MHRSTTASANPAFHVMAKPRGVICNLDCSYCYFLSKEQLYPASRFRMHDELLEQYVRQYVESQRNRQPTSLPRQAHHSS